MRTWNQLNSDEQQRAVNKALRTLITDITRGVIRFNDQLNNDNLQSKIDIAIKNATDNQTPWFAEEFVYEAVGDELKPIANCNAEYSFYPSPNEQIIRI